MGGSSARHERGTSHTTDHSDGRNREPGCDVSFQTMMGAPGSRQIPRPLRARALPPGPRPRTGLEVGCCVERVRRHVVALGLDWLICVELGWERSV